MLVEVLQHYIETARNDTEAGALEQVLGLLLIHIKRGTFVDKDLDVTENTLPVATSPDFLHIHGDGIIFNDLEQILCIGPDVIPLKPMAYKLLSFIYNSHDHWATVTDIHDHVWPGKHEIKHRQSNDLASLLSYCRAQMPEHLKSFIGSGKKKIWLTVP